MRHRLWILALIPAAVLAGALSPLGIFGGDVNMSQLPTGTPQGTPAFTADQGLVISTGNGGWYPISVSAMPTFTITSGCATTSALTGGSTAGSFATSLTGTCTPVINLPAAPNGWSCYAADITHPVVFTQTGSTTTSCTVSGSTTASDVIVFHASGY